MGKAAGFMGGHAIGLERGSGGKGKQELQECDSTH